MATISDINFKKIIDNSSGLAFYQSVAQEIIKFLNQVNSATFWEIIRFTKGNDRRVLRLIDELVNIGLIKFDSKSKLFYLSEGKKVSISPRNVLCKTCGGKIVVIGNRFRKIKEVMEKVYQQKPTPTFLFDQRPVTLDTTLNRVAYMIWRGDFYKKRVAVLGDDDLTSITISLITGAKEVTVFDIDKRLINFIKMISKRYHLKLKAVIQDFTKQLPKKYVNKFDVFLTDPTPTIKPLTLFTDAGVRLLKRGNGYVGYISIFPSHMNKSIKFQKILTKMHLIITDLIPSFIEYAIIKEVYPENDLRLMKKYCKSEGEVSFYEYFMRVETTDATHPLDRIQYREEELLGKVTKEVLNDITKDPALIKGDKKEKDYIRRIAKSMVLEK